MPPVRSRLLVFATLIFTIGVLLSSCSKYSQLKSEPPLADLLRAADSSLKKHPHVFFESTELPEEIKKEISDHLESSIKKYYNRKNLNLVLVSAEKNIQNPEALDLSVFFEDKQGNKLNLEKWTYQINSGEILQKKE